MYCIRDGRGGAFSSGAGREWNSARVYVCIKAKLRFLVNFCFFAFFSFSCRWNTPSCPSTFHWGPGRCKGQSQSGPKGHQLKEVGTQQTPRLLVERFHNKKEKVKVRLKQVLLPSFQKWAAICGMGPTATSRVRSVDTHQGFSEKLQTLGWMWNTLQIC